MSKSNQWQYSLCNCFTGFESPLVCLQGWFCPCWLYGDNNHVFRQQGCCGPCCCDFALCPCTLPVTAGSLRTEIRHKYDIKQGPFPDWLVHTLCCPCAWCQEAKELQGRDVGLYKPPPELQGKNWAKYNLNKPMSSQPMSAPSAQSMAEGLLAANASATATARQERSADGSHKLSTGFHTPIEQEPESPDSYANPLQGFNPIGPLPTTFSDDRYGRGRKKGHNRLDTIASGVPLSDVPTQHELDDLDEDIRRMSVP